MLLVLSGQSLLATWRRRSVIIPPCARPPHTALDPGRRRHLRPRTYRRSGLSRCCRSAFSPSSLRWWGPSRSTRRSFRYRLRTHRARQPRFRPRRCCVDLRRAPPDQFRSAHPDTRSPRVTAVSAREASDYTEGSPGYDYWPEYCYGYPFGGLPGFGFGAGRFHRFARFHGNGFHGNSFHGRAAFHSAARFGRFSPGIGHMGGFGRR